MPACPRLPLRPHVLVTLPVWLVEGMSLELLAMLVRSSDVSSVEFGIVAVECERRDAEDAAERMTECATGADSSLVEPDAWVPSIPLAERYEMWALAAHAAYLAADRDCRGRLLSAAGMRAGVAETDLWSGSAQRAYRYASDELRSWWEIHGRVTPSSFTAAGSASRRAMWDAQVAA